MIGTIDEVKGKAKPGTPLTKAEPEFKTEANGDPEPKPGSKPQPEVEHAADLHES
jgi:hypothetical protein